jgi:predicted O-methyltransferase YrrM
MMLPNWFEGQKHFFERNVPISVGLRVLQIGAYSGDATEWLLNNRNIKAIDDVDTWEGSREDAHDVIDFNEVEDFYQERLQHNINSHVVYPHKMTSDEFFNRQPYTEQYDFIYIDGDHTALQTCLDGLNAWRVLAPGGIMAFDDYQWHLSNPAVAIEDCPKNGIDAVLFVLGTRCEIVEIGYQLWIRKC